MSKAYTQWESFKVRDKRRDVLFNVAAQASKLPTMYNTGIYVGNLARQ